MLTKRKRNKIVRKTYRNVAVGLRSLVVPEENCLITIKHPRVSEFTFDYRHETYRCRRCITGVCGVLSWMITWVASISSHSELSSAESTQTIYQIYLSFVVLCTSIFHEHCNCLSRGRSETIFFNIPDNYERSPATVGYPLTQISFQQGNYNHPNVFVPTTL